MLLNKNESHKVIGEVYRITNIVTNKSYVGQTRSHRLNHGKYRPFGYLGRFKDHIGEANSNKKNQCRYLNASILKYGSDNFICELILTCNVEELDMYEIKYISESNTKFPNGYNLTNGGQGTGYLKGEKIILDETVILDPPVKVKMSLKKSDYTKNLISERLKESMRDPNYRLALMTRTQNQHLSKKFEIFRNVTIDETDLYQYIHILNNARKNDKYIRIIIDKCRTCFVGKHETIEQTTERAIQFITDLIKWQRDQIAGTPLEPLLPLAHGNICEELV
jgi:hypothetical protein